MVQKFKANIGGKQIDQIEGILDRKKHYGGEIIEKLAVYGDPSQAAFTVPMIKDNSTDMSYTGLLTSAISSIRVRGNDKAPGYIEGGIKDDVFDKIAALQFTGFRQIDVKTRRCFEVLNKFKVTANSVNLVGGCSTNKCFTKLLKDVANDYNTQLIESTENYVQDNPAFVAWMGWEYLNSGLQTDIRGKNIYPLNNIPLGSYIDLVSTSFRGIIQNRKIGSKWQRRQAGDE